MENKDIKCDVTTCSYINEEGDCCTLDSVKIHNMNNSKDAETKGDTICASFAFNEGGAE